MYTINYPTATTEKGTPAYFKLFKFDNCNELHPHYDRVQSFYGKAKILTAGEVKYLQSYDTIMCCIVDGKIIKFSNHYSNTTGRHITEFLRQNAINPTGKKAWLNLPMHNIKDYATELFTA